MVFGRRYIWGDRKTIGLPFLIHQVHSEADSLFSSIFPASRLTSISVIHWQIWSSPFSPQETHRDMGEQQRGHSTFGKVERPLCYRQGVCENRPFTTVAAFLFVVSMFAISGLIFSCLALILGGG